MPDDNDESRWAMSVAHLTIKFKPEKCKTGYYRELAQDAFKDLGKCESHHEMIDYLEETFRQLCHKVSFQFEDFLRESLDAGRLDANDARVIDEIETIRDRVAP